MKIQSVSYQEGEQELIGQFCFNQDDESLRPLVIVFPAFEGLSPLYIDYAKKAVELGYRAFVADIYGDGLVCQSFEECVEHVMKYIEDRQLNTKRVSAALEAALQQSGVDKSNVATIGFCFGGMCGLDLARTGAEVKATVSCHGVWAVPPELKKEPIKGKVLCCHGYLDPQVPPEQVQELAKEMTQDGVDWQVHFYGEAKHAFTDPEAAQFGPPEMGRVYNKEAAERSWQAASNLFAEVFNQKRK